MKITESFTETPEKITEISNCVDILAEDGGALFRLELNSDGSLTISTGMAVKHSAALLTGSILVFPQASNSIRLARDRCPDGNQ